MSKKKPYRKGGGQALWWVAGVAVIAVGVLISISLIGRNNNTAATGGKSDAEVHANRNVKGAETAKVKLVEYSDFL
ncbi:MAG TPA: hypothetical protein VNT01_01605 [Symbiobacteriaceae bacterium]|nr:hypothetical protein [Symbiobacteriaceae bacterium]